MDRDEYICVATAYLKRCNVPMSNGAFRELYLLDVVRDAGLRADLMQIRNILRDSWGLRSDRNSDYTFSHIGTEGDPVPAKRRGRYFEVNRELVDKLLL